MIKKDTDHVLRQDTEFKFPPRVDLDFYGWTAEHGKQVRVVSDGFLQKVVILQDPRTPNEAEKILLRIAQDTEINCLLSEHEQYWALRTIGVLPRRQKDALCQRRYMPFIDSPVTCRLKPIVVTDKRTSGVLFTEKKDSFEMPTLPSYITPMADMNEGSRSRIPADVIATKFDEWICKRTLVQRLVQFRIALSQSRGASATLWKTWSNDDIAAMFVIHGVLGSFTQTAGQYLRVWEAILRSQSHNNLVYMEARMHDRVLMMTQVKKDSPFWLGFKDRLWKRVRDVESVKSYDPYYKQTPGYIEEFERVNESELFRPFFIGKQNHGHCQPGAPGETLIHETAVADFSLMMIHLRLIELRCRLTSPLRDHILKTGSRLFEVCNPPSPYVRSDDWIKRLPLCLSKQVRRLINEIAQDGKLEKQTNLQWELQRTLETVVQLYRANDWPMTDLADIHPFDRLDRAHVTAAIQAKTDPENLSCRFFFSKNACPFSKGPSGSSSSECVSQCKKSTQVEDVEDLANQLCSTTASVFPVIDNWNPWVAMSIKTCSSLSTNLSS